jgi:septal ring factor EnvC (AmiA/AmiB activator)
MPESIRNAIVVAFIAVLVAMVCVGLLLWRGRPAAPPARASRGLPLLVTDRDGGVSDLSIKLQQMERRVGESQITSQQLMEQLKEAEDERTRLATRLAGLEKEVRTLRKRVQENEQRPVLKPTPEKKTTTPPLQPAAPATTTTPPVDVPAAPPP